jgi:hypothetical protein
MADLSELNSSGATRVVGADSSGTEIGFVKSSLNGDLSTSDTLQGPGVQGVISVGTSAVELKVGGSALAYRKLATVYNDSSNIIYWGYTSGVTTSTGTPLEKKQLASWNISDNTNATIFLIAGSASNNVRATESA